MFLYLCSFEEKQHIVGVTQLKDTQSRGEGPQAWWQVGQQKESRHVAATSNHPRHLSGAFLPFQTHCFLIPQHKAAGRRQRLKEQSCPKGHTGLSVENRNQMEVGSIEPDLKSLLDMFQVTDNRYRE